MPVGRRGVLLMGCSWFTGFAMVLGLKGTRSRFWVLGSGDGKDQRVRTVDRVGKSASQSDLGSAVVSKNESVMMMCRDYRVYDIRK